MKLHERGLAMSKILIVEDEESIADIEKDYLELNGYEVEVCNDGTSGLAAAPVSYTHLTLHCMRILICVSLILCFPELMVSRYASR